MKYADITVRLDSVRTRFRVLWGAIKYLFTGRGVWLTAGVQAHIGHAGISASSWVQRDRHPMWEHWAIVVDFDNVKVYVDDILAVDVSVPTKGSRGEEQSW